MKKKAVPSFRNLVLAQGKLSYTVMNLYPYNNGHLMVAPYRHVGTIEALTHAEWSDLLRLAQDATDRLRQVFSPEGYNLGINVGRAAGAGIPGHLHLHIVPRWNGDTNFITIISSARVVSRSLRTTYRLLKAAGLGHVRS